MTIASALITDFGRETPKTLQLLEAVPADKLGWKPHEKSWSLGQLAGHIAESPSWLSSVLEKELDFGEMGEYQPFNPETPEQLLETYRKNAAGFVPLMTGKTDDFMSETWIMRKGDKVLMEGARADVVREIMIHHEIHHRGQLSMYLRQLGVKLPATYGDSADVSMF